MKREALAIALGAAQGDPCATAPTQLDAKALALLCIAVQMGVFEQLTPGERWQTLADALMAPRPAGFFEALREAGGLKRFLPEVDALFGVPQLSDQPEPVDVGLHQLQLLNETAKAEAPLAVRFAALMHKIGKGGTQRDIWPSHYKHELRAHAMLDRIALAFAAPAEPLALARLVIDECDRIHRASDMRAGPIAAMLDRLQAHEQPERFEQLLSVCAYDYAAYAEHSASEYPKGPRLRKALAAYSAADVQGMSADEALQARAVAISQALRGQAHID
jgi:tRNA nucleotidyltransferase (CCA-adding enzyme)